jgi:hypothetical protein
VKRKATTEYPRTLPHSGSAGISWSCVEVVRVAPRGSHGLQVHYSADVAATASGLGATTELETRSELASGTSGMAVLAGRHFRNT